MPVVTAIPVEPVLRIALVKRRGSNVGTLEYAIATMSEGSGAGKAA
jgi:hypothetical protein